MKTGFPRPTWSSHSCSCTSGSKMGGMAQASNTPKLFTGASALGILTPKASQHSRAYGLAILDQMPKFSSKILYWRQTLSNEIVQSFFWRKAALLSHNAVCVYPQTCSGLHGISLAFTGTHGGSRTSTDLSPGCSARWEIKVRAGWAYCQRHNEVTEQKLPKVLPSCYESTKNDGEDADDDVQGILFPVTDEYMVS